MGKYLITLICLFALASGLFAAECAAGAYAKACSSCTFDANGKMDQACYGGYKASGLSCISAKYPITAAKYSQGKCPQFEGCISDLSSCTAQYSSGNDKADCAEGSVAVCFASADACAKSAAVKCEGIESPCGAPAALILSVIVGMAFVRRQ